MSAFLGPIHYWLYRKVMVQNELVIAVCEFAKQKDIHATLLSEAEQKYGVLETKPLEEVIDGGNIHGWLQERIHLIENQYAYTVSKIVEKNPEAFEELKTTIKEAGKKIEKDEFHSAPEVYQFLQDTLLDGMPCDHVNALVEKSDEEVVYKRNQCVHGEFWDAAGLDASYYYELRQAFIEGLLEDTKFAYVQEDNMNKIVQK